jgi:hypothetical protein
MKKTTTYDLGNPFPGLGQAQKCGGLNRVIGIPTLTLLITGSPMTIQIYIKRYTFFSKVIIFFLYLFINNAPCLYLLQADSMSRY